MHMVLSQLFLVGAPQFFFSPTKCRPIGSAVGALGNLACNPVVKVKLVEGGAVPLINGALGRHKEDADVQKYGEEALKNLK